MELARVIDAPLTSREREVAALLAEALSNRQIAARLLSERTVDSHVRSILAKTQCANRTEFVARRVTLRGRLCCRPRGSLDRESGGRGQQRGWA